MIDNDSTSQPLSLGTGDAPPASERSGIKVAVAQNRALPSLRRDSVHRVRAGSYSRSLIAWHLCGGRKHSETVTVASQRPVTVPGRVSPSPCDSNRSLLTVIRSLQRRRAAPPASGGGVSRSQPPVPLLVSIIPKSNYSRSSTSPMSPGAACNTGRKHWHLE